MLTVSQKKMLIDIARRSIEAQLNDVPLELPQGAPSPLMERKGAFVTLKINGMLRGCIGTFMADRPLIEIVANMAHQAAFHDPRFRPLTRHEYEEVTIEISALSPLKEISDIEEITVGTHGIYIIRGGSSGVLLPQVAVEYNWDRIKFLEQTCLKTGLWPDCWKEEGTKILIFSAEVFSEEEL